MFGIKQVISIEQVIQFCKKVLKIFQASWEFIQFSF